MRFGPVILLAGGLGALAYALRRAADPTAEPLYLPLLRLTDTVVEPIARIMGASRGIRNNNPGNIVRTGERWQGMSADQSSDPRFVVFDSPVYGIRALARILRKYHASGLTSIQAIINRYAPPSENDTGAYARAVAAALGVSPTQPVALSDSVMGALIAAIIKHENGSQPYSGELIVQGIQMERQS